MRVAAELEGRQAVGSVNRATSNEAAALLRPATRDEEAAMTTGRETEGLDHPTLRRLVDEAGTINALVAPGKGLLAADESLSSIARRFEPFGIEPTEESRRQYRQMLFTTPGVAEYISGVILFDETLRQGADDGRPFAMLLADQGLVPGIKVDEGTVPLAGAPGEQITEGLDGLRQRLEEYRSLGVRFAKWRAVITIGDGRPSGYCFDTNAHALARYASLCQEAGLVPIVEPEVLMDGTHPLERTFDVTQATLERVFAALRAQRVVLEHLLLKPNMVVPGSRSERRARGARCGGGDSALPPPDSTRCSAGYRLSLGRAGASDCDRAPERHERERHERRTSGAPVARQLLFRACAAGSRAGGLAGGEPRHVGAGQQAFRRSARCNAAAKSGAGTRQRWSRSRRPRGTPRAPAVSISMTGARSRSDAAPMTGLRARSIRGRGG